MIKKLGLIVCSCLFLAACQSCNCDATKLDAWRIRVETQKEPELLSKLRKITSLTLGDNQLILGYSPDIEPPTVKLEADEMATKAKHLVALGAVILILSMILLFILLSRRKKRLQKLHAS